MPAEASNATADQQAVQPAAWKWWLVACGVYAGFLAYSFVQAPIPAPNEPHYLTKAKRYWDPQFCPRDVFLDSTDAHPVFYQTVGLLTTFLSLEQTAFVGRLLAYALLAFGWTSCLSRLLENTAAPLWASWVFLALATFGNLSGEWMVGGVEAKVFSYALVLWGLGMIFSGRPLRAAAALGLAVAFHPVVGVWAAICTLYAAIWHRYHRKREAGETASGGAGPFKSGLAALAVGLICALPGLIPALMLVLGDAHPDSAEANRIQVLQRLAHHLDPTAFKKIETEDLTIHAAWVGYAGLFLFWLCVRRRGFHASAVSFAQRWFFHFVIMSAVIALAGLVVGWLPRGPLGQPDANAPLFDVRVTLMKFYPFRLFDVFVPLAAALALTRVLAAPAGGSTGRLLNAGLFCGFLVFALLRPIPDRNPSHMTAEQREEWIAVCRWIREHTPRDARFLTGSSSWAFKWYAGRAEYHSHKDCPQDTARILEWRRRARYLDAWDRKYPDAYTKEALRELMTREGVTHIVCAADVGPFAIPPIYPDSESGRPNAMYRVYRLRDAFDGEEPQP